MLPKNKLRADMVKQHLTIIYEPYHNYGNILPQFTEMIGRDVNIDSGYTDTTKENTIVRHMSATELPEEFKGFNMDIDETM